MAGVLDIYYGEYGASGFVLEGVVTLQAELTMDETYDLSSTVTGYPVEDGVEIGDHIIRQPIGVTVTGIVTDNPVIVDSDAKGAVQDAFLTIERLWKESQPLTLVTSMKRYKNMVLTNASLPRNRMEAMEFTLDFQQITIVKPETAEVPDIKVEPLRDRASGRRNAGRQQGTNPSAEDVEVVEKTIPPDNFDRMEEVFGWKF